MTRSDFLSRLALVAGGALVFSAALRLGLGARWFSFYGWASVALATLPFVIYLLWTRLPRTGRSRWWSLLVVLPVLVAAAVQIVFWVVFFGQGGSNPTFGLMREMMRPWLDAGEPFLLAGLAAISAWLFLLPDRPALTGAGAA